MCRLLKLRNLLPTLLILVCLYFFLSFSVQASALPRPVTGVMAQPTLPTPAPLIELTISSASGNAVLNWSDNLPENSYEVHRSTAPFFALDGSTLLAAVSANVNTYTDLTSGVGNVNVNHYYKIKAILTSGNGDSNYVGEIDYPINTSSGAYSMVGIPFLAPELSDAAGLAARIGSVSNVYQWDPTTQSFRVFTPPTIDNFTFTYGDAIFVQVGNGASASVNVAGKVDAIALALHPNNYSFIALPVHCDELSNASGTAADISGVINLLQWDQAFQSFLTFTPPNVGDNFPLKLGDPFIVQLTAGGPSSWPSYLTSTCR